MTDTKDRLKQWITRSETDPTELKQLIVELILIGIDTEDISFYSNAIAPYWTHSGEPLIEGQDCYLNEE